MKAALAKTPRAQRPYAAAGMALQLIRKMIIDEPLDADAEPAGRLELLRMAPSKWLEGGKKILIERMPTYYGETSLNLKSQPGDGRIAGRFQAPADAALKRVELWLKHPKGFPIRAVRINGESRSDFTPASILLPATGTSDFEVEYEETKSTP